MLQLGFENILLNERSQSQKVGFLLYELSRRGKSIDRKQISGCLVMEEEEMGTHYFNEYGVLCCDDETVLKLQRSGSYTTLNALNATELYTLKWLIVM